MSTDDVTDPLLGPEDSRFAELLEEARPAPPSSFRGALANRLSDQDPGWGPRPERLWPQALILIAVGALLLLVGALIATGGL